MEDMVYEQSIAFNVMQIGELVAKLSDDYRAETCTNQIDDFDNRQE